MESARTIQVGAARVSLLNAGMMRLRLADEYAVPEAEWRPKYAEAFDAPALFPSLSALIEVGDARILVDANDYRATVTPDSEYHVPDYTPPPPIADQVASMGVPADGVTHVVITHAHWDHYTGLTYPASGVSAPTFPQASVYLGQADWEDAETQTALGDSASLEARTLGVLKHAGLLELVAGPLSLAPGVDVIPAPGETPGHQIVRVQSEGQTLYILGDLVHSPVEIERPDWMVTWATREPMLASRRRLLDNALAEGALLTAAHIATIGRLERDGDDLRWALVS